MGLEPVRGQRVELRRAADLASALQKEEVVDVILEPRRDLPRDEVLGPVGSGEAYEPFLAARDRERRAEVAVTREVESGYGRARMAAAFLRISSPQSVSTRLPTYPASTIFAHSSRACRITAA